MMIKCENDKSKRRLNDDDDDVMTTTIWFWHIFAWAWRMPYRNENIKTTAGSSFTHSTDYEWTHLEKWLSMGCVREFCQEICLIQFEFKKLTPISSKKWFPFSFTHPSNDKQTNRILIIAMRKNKFSHAEMCCRLLT